MFNMEQILDDDDRFFFKIVGTVALFILVIAI